MKREASDTPDITSSPTTFSKPQAKTSPSRKQARTTPKSLETDYQFDGVGTQPRNNKDEGWTPEKREELMTRVISAGINAAGGIANLAKDVSGSLWQGKT